MLATQRLKLAAVSRARPLLSGIFGNRLSPLQRAPLGTLAASGPSQHDSKDEPCRPLWANSPSIASAGSAVASSSIAASLPSLRRASNMGVLREHEPAEVRQLVVTASGPDRPGIVSRVSKCVLECGGNVEESRMARLAGDFSIIMLVSIDATTPQKAEELQQRLLQIQGLQVHSHWTEDDRCREKAPKRKFRRISLRGADNPGLVYNVAEYLASNNINIENLETATQEAPFGGSILFSMDGVITMPLHMSTSRLLAHLQVLQTTLGVDITLANLDPNQKAEDVSDWKMQRTLRINDDADQEASSAPSMPTAPPPSF
eukprot:TRINITY_DN82_c0_g1_i1.p1 TRINITY_DN82_c0_g1~~TRINITY_DN82_c0_g1_i1.p1  ORF type:complete len:317 (+),score=46.47 TRINITY_DN82_c0_g1_i1:223-1173(+)